MHPSDALMLALGLTLCALAAPAAGQTAYGCKSVISSIGTGRVYRQNPGLQSASEFDLPLTAGKCLSACSNLPALTSFGAAGVVACFCGSTNATGLSAGASCSAVCNTSAICTVGSQNISEAATLDPIVSPTLNATAGPSITDTVPMVNVSASAKFLSLTTFTAFDYDPHAQSIVQPLINVPSASNALVIVRPTYKNRRGLLCVRYATTAATTHKTVSYKVFYPLSGHSLELDYGNNTPGYYRVLEELRVYFRVNLGSNMTARIDFGDLSAPPIQFASLTDTFPVTYRRVHSFVNRFTGWLDPANTVTVFTSFGIDANVTIRAVVAFVNTTSASAIVRFMVLRPLCSQQQATYCYRANTCTTNCSALPGARATACGTATWSAVPRACGSSAALSPALFSGGRYYLAQAVNATVQQDSSFQTIKLSTGLNCIPGDLLALHEFTPVILAQNATSITAEREVALTWSAANFVDFVLNGTNYKTVNLTSAPTRSSAKAVQFLGNRQLSVMTTHTYRNFNCNWTTSFCNNEYPFNVTLVVSSSVGGSPLTTQMPVIIQIPITNVIFTSPLYNQSYRNVPFLISQHSGSKPVYNWSVNDSSLTNFNATMVAFNYYNFTKDGFFNVCLTAANGVSSSSFCNINIIQNPVASGVTYVFQELLLATTPTSQALSTVFLTWNASNSNVPTNVSATLDMGDGTAPVYIIVDWSTSRRVVQYMRNYSRGTYNRSVLMYNQVSSQSHTSFLVVQETLLNAALVASSYVLPPGVPLTFTLTLTWGSDYNATIFFGDGSSTTQVVTSNNRSVVFTYSYANIGNYSVRCVISNRVSSLTVALDRGFLETMYSPLGFALTASRLSLLRRPSNTTDTQLQICRDSTINAAQPLYEVRYNVDFGDGSSPRLSGVSLPSCLTSNSTLNAACASAFGANYVHCLLVPTMHYTFPGNFTATVRIYNKAGHVNVTWYSEVYSQIVNLNREIILYPVYSGNTLVQNAARSGIYPLEKPLRFFAVTQFGQFSPLVFNWNFGDGRTAVTSVNEVENLFAKPTTYTVKVNVTNPLMWQADSYSIELRRSVVDIKASTPVSFPMIVPYEVIVDFAAFPTLSCFMLDFSNFGSRVSSNGSLHMFGHETTCRTLAPFSTFATGSYYWDPLLTDFYLSNYQVSLTSTPPSSKMTIIKVFNNYGAYPVTLYGANSFSSLTFTWVLTVAKGFCSSPVAGLASRLVAPRFKRNEIITIGGDIQISCFNTSTHVKWTVEERNIANGLWADYVGNLRTFFTTYLPLENLNSQLEGDWYGAVNANLRRLILPAFSLNIQRTYRVCVQLTMNDEITINSTDCVTFEVYKAPLEPCFKMHYSKNRNITWTAIQNPAQAPYESLIRVDPSCSVNPNKFEASGLQSQKTCWSPAYYCQRDCEGNIVFGPNFTYNTSAQIPCTKYTSTGATVFEKSCFINDALSTWQHLPQLSQADWKVNITTNYYPHAIVKNVYDQIAEWRADAGAGKFNYLYFISNGMVYIDTSFSFETGSLKIYVVMTDLCDDLPPIAAESQLMITKGTPPIVTGV